MTPQRWDGDPAPTRHPVFLDETGRRRRWVNRCSAVLVVGCAAYAAVVGGELAQTGVGPLSYVPAIGNGLIAGFPADPGVPGLLAAAPAFRRPETTHPETTRFETTRRETTGHRETVPTEVHAVAFHPLARAGTSRSTDTRAGSAATPVTPAGPADESSRRAP